jgi:hypothetical protein
MNCEKCGKPMAGHAEEDCRTVCDLKEMRHRVAVQARELTQRYFVNPNDSMYQIIETAMTFGVKIAVEVMTETER